MAEFLLAGFGRGSLDAHVLSDERAERLHRAAELIAEDAQELLGLFLRGLVVDEHTEPQLPSGMTFGVSAIDGTLNAQLRSLAYADQENVVEKPLFPSAE